LSTEEIIQESDRYIMNTYRRLPVVIVKGRGTRVYDADGKEYLDFVSGVAVTNLGHCYPRVTVAFQKQAQRLSHVSNLYYSEPQTKLAKMLVNHSCMDKVFFCNSGAEANEAAIKLTRRYAQFSNQKGRYEIITMNNSFHGRTLTTLSATGQEKVKQGFHPLAPGFVHVPFNDVDAVAKAIDAKTLAVMVEPIQGEGGVNLPSDDYLPKIKQLCQENGLLLIFDEIQTGIGRTGTLFAYEHYNVQPDILTLAKGLGGGLPLGAMLAREGVASAFEPGQHASTFGGNPVVCASALAMVETVLEDGFLLDNCQRMGDYLLKGLRDLQRSCPCIKEVRGKGLLIGLELTCDGKEVVQECLQEGFLINCTMDRVLRFLPPLIITMEEIDLLLNVLEKILRRKGGSG
jgi:predicted acetylornithine/succinylornithine family transaminase